MENQLVKLPAEVEQLAQGVTVEKRNEVQAVLNHVFNGVSSMREQLDAVAVKDENDTASMKVANTIRLNVRRVRLDAEKTFDAKRAEVQAQMISFKTEDALWLKAKQTMQILTKEIEETAKLKEDTKARIEAERQELKIAQRLQQMQAIRPECQRSDVEFLSDDMFITLLNAAKIEQQRQIEEQQKAEAERIDTERKEKLLADRRSKTIRLVNFIENYEDVQFGEISEDEFMQIVNAAIAKRTAHEEEQERIKKDLEEKEAALQAERKKREAEAAEAARKQKEIEEAAKKAQAEAARKAAEEKKKANEEAAALREKLSEQERAEKQRKEAEEAAKNKAAEEEAERQKAQAEAAKKAASAPDREKLLKLAEMIDCISMPELSSLEATEIANNARGLLDKVIAYINSNAAAL